MIGSRQLKDLVKRWRANPVKKRDYDNYKYYRVNWSAGVKYGSDSFFTRKEARDFKKYMQERGYEAHIFKYEVSSGYYMGHGEVF